MLKATCKRILRMGNACLKLVRNLMRQLGQAFGDLIMRCILLQTDIDNEISSHALQSL